MLPPSSPGCRTVVVLIVSASVRICDPDEQMASECVHIPWWGQVGLAARAPPGHTPILPLPSPAHPAPHVAGKIGRQNRTAGLGQEPSRSCPVQLLMSVLRPTPTDPAPGQCGGMVKPLISGARQNWISVLTASFPDVGSLGQVSDYTSLCLSFLICKMHTNSVECCKYSQVTASPSLSK